MFKNYNQVTLPTGSTLILLGIFMGAILPKLDWDVTVDNVWVGFTITLGCSFVLLSFKHPYVTYSGLVFLGIAAILLLFALAG